MNHPSKHCLVCNGSVKGPVWESGTTTMDSLCQTFPFNTAVYYCKDCAHIQSTPLPDLSEYYNSNYDQLTTSEDADQIYAVEGDRKIYRYEFQAETLLEKLTIPEHAKVLDFGASKGATLRIAKEQRADIVPYLFDVSDSWQSFWDRFVPSEQTSSYTIPESWNDQMDVVVSFFVLEHVVDPNEYIQTARRVLKTNGQLYFIVPNPFVNIVDLTVADHTHHYTETSLRVLLERNGFTVSGVDSTTHERAFIVAAQKTASPTTLSTVSKDDVKHAHKKTIELGHYWADVATKIDSWVEQVGDRPVAIYGAGVYGTRIANQIRDHVKITQFLDQSEYLQGTQHTGITVVAPEQLSEDVSDVLVGLNPLKAREIIEEISSWDGRGIRFYYL